MAGPPLNERVASLETAVDNLTEEVKSLKRSAIGSGFAVVGAVLVYLFRESATGASAEAVARVTDALPF